MSNAAVFSGKQSRHYPIELRITVKVFCVHYQIWQPPATCDSAVVETELRVLLISYM